MTRQPKGITACWTRSRLCVGPVRTLQPSAATHYVSLCLVQVPELPVSTSLRCLTTRRATAGATPPKVKISRDFTHELYVHLSVRAVIHVHPCECLTQRKLNTSDSLSFQMLFYYVFVSAVCFYVLFLSFFILM